MTASFGGRTATRAYDSLSRLTSVTRTNGTSSTYTYEIDSDLATLTHAFASGSTPTSATWGFTSDASAKVTGITISAPVLEWTPPTGYGRTYGAANNLNQVTSENGVTVNWNADGNMISDGINTYSWTYGNRMMGASRSGMTATYDYDSDDRRTKKTVNGVVTRTMWSGADEVGEYNAAGTLIRRFVPDGSGGMDARLMTVEADGTAYWHHTDRQGSVVATSNAAGQVVATATYSPHGEFGTGTTAPPTGSPFGYTGRQYDPETGLYQYRARYYSPRLGVFLSTDPIGTRDDPNVYLYVGADPVNHTDPTGRSHECRPTPCPANLNKAVELVRLAASVSGLPSLNAVSANLGNGEDGTGVIFVIGGQAASATAQGTVMEGRPAVMMSGSYANNADPVNVAAVVGHEIGHSMDEFDRGRRAATADEIMATELNAWQIEIETVQVLGGARYAGSTHGPPSATWGVAI